MALFSFALAVSTLVSTPLILLLIGLVFSIMLTIAHNKLKVKVDPRVSAIRDALPGANCGGCGFASCDAFAEAVAAGTASPDGCVVLSTEALQTIAGIMGIEASVGRPKRSVIHCGAQAPERLARAEYRGAQTCTEMNLIAGVQGCTHGCLGLGDCAEACPFDAIEIVGGLAVVDYVACTGCGNCVAACPRGIISIEEMIDDPLVVIACSSKDPGKYTRGNCKVGCIACGLCSKLKPDVFSVEGNLCTIDYASASYGKTEDLDAVVGKCPTVCLRRVGSGISNPHDQVEQRAREKAAKAKAKAEAAEKASAPAE